MGLSIEAKFIKDVVSGETDYGWFYISQDMDLLRTLSILHENAIMLEISNHKYYGGIPCPSHLTIPSSYQGNPVLAVYGSLAYLDDDGDNQWTEENYDINSLTISEGIAIVDKSLWDECPNLKSIKLPQSMINK